MAYLGNAKHLFSHWRGKTLAVRLSYHDSLFDSLDNTARKHAMNAGKGKQIKRWAYYGRVDVGRNKGARESDFVFKIIR